MHIFRFLNLTLLINLFQKIYSVINSLYIGSCHIVYHWNMWKNQIGEYFTNNRNISFCQERCISCFRIKWIFYKSPLIKTLTKHLMVFQNYLYPSLQNVKVLLVHLQMLNLIHINYYKILKLIKILKKNLLISSIFLFCILLRSILLLLNFKIIHFNNFNYFLFLITSFLFLQVFNHEFIFLTIYNFQFSILELQDLWIFQGFQCLNFLNFFSFIINLLFNFIFFLLSFSMKII